MDKKRILIVKLSSLGDVIFNLPLANIFKQNGYEVTWITGEKGFDVINNNPLVDEAILAPIIKWKKQPLWKNIIEYFKIIKYIRSKHFDIAIDTQLLLKSFIWIVLSGAKRRIVSKGAREFSILGGNEVIDKIHNDFTTHVTKNYLKYADYLGLDTSNVHVELPPSTSEVIEKIDGYLQNIDSSKPVVTIAPATTWETKHWNKDYWKEVIQAIEDKYNLIFTGTAKDIELIDYISGGKHLCLAGKTNLMELTELFRRSDLVISLDSGSTHLAWASGHPKIISIFCSTPYKRYAPLGDEDKYIALSGNIPCQHCHSKKCPLQTNECTFYPKADEVLNAVSKLLP